jgi:steroid delta-isomerase-like uncharacterized protein
MSTHPLVDQFYARVWNSGDESVGTLLAEDFAFYGSLGTPTLGHAEFLKIVRSVRASLANYNCAILECVTEEPKAFARMRFSGTHVAVFRGFAPTGKQVQWNGAALFSFRDGLINELWVLSDLVGLDDALRKNSSE